MSTSKRGGKVLAIKYEVWISGRKLSGKKKACINSIDIKETVYGSDSATIHVQDPNFLFIEDNIFLEENSVKVQLGWDNTTYRVTFDGYISAVDVVFASDGIPSLTITCIDRTHKMNRAKNSETFKDTTNADVVKTLVMKYGFQCVVDSEYSFEKKETITQSNQTDIEFITQLANSEVYPFTARLVGNTFYYVRMGKIETPKMALTYKKFPHEIISFNPKVNKETKKVEIKEASINASDKKVSTTVGTTVSSSSGKSSSEMRGSSSEDGSSSSRQASGGYTYS